MRVVGRDLPARADENVAVVAHANHDVELTRAHDQPSANANADSQSTLLVPFVSGLRPSVNTTPTQKRGVLYRRQRTWPSARPSSVDHKRSAFRSAALRDILAMGAW